MVFKVGLAFAGSSSLWYTCYLTPTLSATSVNVMPDSFRFVLSDKANATDFAGSIAYMPEAHLLDDFKLRIVITGDYVI